MATNLEPVLPAGRGQRQRDVVTRLATWFWGRVRGGIVLAWREMNGE